MSGAKVWLIGGTSESAELALALAARQLPFVVTVTTETARTLYSTGTQVVVGALTRSQMSKFVLQQQIRCVLDASHPFATAVSESAIAAATQTIGQGEIAYIRYERDPLSPYSSDQVSVYTSLEALLNPSQLCNQRILFTLGYRSLLSTATQLAQLQQISALFIRILPSPIALSTALRVGFSAKNIVALRPPISYDLEKALWQQWNISLVIAKASGQAGGETIKRRVAAELGVHLRLLQRPPIKYPHQTHCLSEAIRFCEDQMAEGQISDDDR